ncbi:TetR/AcrR family transcriptional regulator [soil metagenome]
MATRDTVVRVAVDRFCSVGYAGTSMRDIARAAGIRPASIYNHFVSKEEILWEVFQQATSAITVMQAEARDALPEGAGIEERVRAFVRTHALYHTTYGRLAVVSHTQLVSLEEIHRASAIGWRDDYEHSLRVLVEAGMIDGVFDVPDAKMYSFAIIQMGLSIATWYRPDGSLGPDAVADHYEEIAARMIGLRRPV